MKPDRFKELLDELDGNSLQTLKEKNARYAQNGDCLHNFRSGADIAGGTPAQACWGYVTKHLVALRDMVEKNDFSNREDFLEKCQDTINYIRFLWCIGNDECGEVEGKLYADALEAMSCHDPNDGVKSHVLLDPCRYEGIPMHPYGDNQCMAVPGFKLCHSRKNCEIYEPKTD